MNKYITSTILFSTLFVLSDSLQASLECPIVRNSRDFNVSSRGNNYTLYLRTFQKIGEFSLAWDGNNTVHQATAPIVTNIDGPVSTHPTPDFSCSYTGAEPTGTGFPVTIHPQTIYGMQPDITLVQAQDLIKKYISDHEVFAKYNSKEWTINIDQSELLNRELQKITFQPKIHNVTRLPDGTTYISAQYYLNFKPEGRATMTLTAPITIEDF